MKNRISISAVICSYNGGTYLQSAVDSVLAQQPPPEEFIIVDDCSTDGSAAFLGEVQRRHPGLVTVIRHERNRGQAAGMNTAFAASHGEILAFLDSDDVWFPEKLTAVRAACEAQPDLGLFQHNLLVMNGDECTEERFLPAMAEGDVFELWLRYGTFPNFSPTTGLAIRREVFAKLAPLPEELLICADAYLTRTAICFGPLVSTLAPYGGYRRHGSNNVYGNDQLDGWQFVQENIVPLLAAFYRAHGLALPSQIQPRRNGDTRNRLVDIALDLSLRKILRRLRGR